MRIILQYKSDDKGFSLIALIISIAIFVFLVAGIGFALTHTTCQKNCTPSFSSSVNSTQQTQFHPINVKTFSVTPSHSQTLSYQVVGKHIVDNSGNIYVPYGTQITAPAMAQKDWLLSQSNSQYITQQAMQQAHDFWYSNATRLQVSSANLFSQSPYNTSYLARIDQIVGWANALHMNIIISLQYEVTTQQLMPTQDSVDFWHVIAKHYGTNPRVFFDIFNEPIPSILNGQKGDTVPTWNFWQNGGIGVDGRTYVGMQQLVNTIRRDGVNNIIFAQGPAAGEDITQLSRYQLSGSNIVYAIHPYLNATIHHTVSDWDHWFGNTATTGNFPVVADEWNEWESSRPECITDAPTIVPQFLAYLKSHSIGLIAYAFWPGTLIRGWNPTSPTMYIGTTTICPGNTSPNINFDPNAQGAGQLIQQYFTQNNP